MLLRVDKVRTSLGTRISPKHGVILVMLITGYRSVVNCVLELYSMTARRVSWKIINESISDGQALASLASSVNPLGRLGIKHCASLKYSAVGLGEFSKGVGSEMFNACRHMSGRRVLKTTRGSSRPLRMMFMSGIKDSNCDIY
jgi:hypothetical protein